MKKLTARTIYIPLLLLMATVRPVPCQMPQLVLTCPVGTDMLRGCIHECTGSSESVISTNKTLTPPNQIVASFHITDREAERVLNLTDSVDNETRTWCTLSSSTDEERYIIISFSYPVLITAIISSGTTEERRGGFQTFLVTNFTVDYLTIENDTVTYSTQSQNPKYFASPRLNTFTRIEEPFVARNIRFNAIEWYDSEETSLQYVCLGVAIFGCLESEAMSSPDPCPATSEPPTTTTCPTSIDATTHAVDGNMSACDCSTQTSITNTQTGGGQSLTIVLPTVIAVLIVVVLLSVTVGVVSYFVIRKKGEGNIEQRKPILLQSLRSQDLTDGGTIRKVDNAAYELTNNSAQEGEENQQANYEEVNPTIRDRMDSMEYNTSYGEVDSTQYTSPNPSYVAHEFEQS